MAKSREDFTDAELRKLHDEISRAETKAERAAIYDRLGVTGQAVGQWFRRMNLAPISGESPKAVGAKGRGRSAGTQTKRGPGRPKGKSAGKAGSKGKNGIARAGASRGRKPAGRGLGLSKEAKETVIRLLSMLLED